MSFSNSQQRNPRVTYFVRPQAAPGMFAPGTFSLPVKGQGVFVCMPRYPESGSYETQIAFLDESGTDGLRIVVNIHTWSLYRMQGDRVLQTARLAVQAPLLWISLDAQHQCLTMGYGETRSELQHMEYAFGSQEKAFLESLVQLKYDEETVLPLRYLRDPVLKNTPLPMVVEGTDQLTMADIAGGKILPAANLSAVGRKLYDNVSGKRFILNDEDFPHFSDAIEESIRDPEGWCHQKLEKKAAEFGKPDLLKTYLRITLGENNGESPGIPYVMEIWPPQHYSPIHNHAGANAIIRVLHGSIHVDLYPWLGAPAKFREADFGLDQITWISPTLNQTHRLTNIHKDTTCITIQCYMYDENDSVHYDYFDYLEDDGGVGHYEPDSDMEFLEFRDLMKAEWKRRHRLP